MAPGSARSVESKIKELTFVFSFLLYLFACFCLDLLSVISCWVTNALKVQV